jgi:hypothetical protein
VRSGTWAHPDYELHCEVNRLKPVNGRSGKALEGATGKALPPGAAATARLLGKRLQMVVGRPVALGEGEIGTVVRAHVGHQANAYRVAIAPADGGP